MADSAATGTAHPRRRRIGVVGYGALGQFLVARILRDPTGSAAFELAFVWNRSGVTEAAAASGGIPATAVCADLSTVALFTPDLIVEVCHPLVVATWGARFMGCCDLFIASPTALADGGVLAGVQAAAVAGGHAAYVPAGALWGSVDIERLSARGGLASLEITMAKHPASLKLEGALGARVAALLADGTPGDTVLYEGPVRHLCPLAPNNVNTMAAAAVAAPSLGFDGVVARLISNPALDAHVITIVATGQPQPDGSALVVRTVRSNPAPPGAVTGSATFASFYSSLFNARGRGAGVFLC